MTKQSTLQNRWLMVVLVCAVQLATAISLIIYGMSHFHNRSLTMLRQQSVDEISSMTIALADKINERFGSSSEVLTDSLREFLIENSRTTSLKIGMADARSCKLQVLVEDGRPLNVTALEDNLASMKFRSLSGNGDTVELAVAYRNPLCFALSGIGELDDSDHLLCTRRILDGNYLLIVGRNDADITSQYMAWIPAVARIVVLVTVLVGFLAIFLNTSILQKFDNEIGEMHKELNEALLARTHELGETQRGVIFGLAKLAESRDNDTGDHLDRIRNYVVLLAQELRGEFPEIDDTFIDNISSASSLHDIGKVGIPDAVLLKPGRLTDLERKIMEFHTVIGGECLQAIQRRLAHDEFLKMAHDIAVSHHERWDGTGYPHRLAGEQIPLAARILSVADVYDALTSKRPYKAPMSHEKSAQLIREGSGTQFDARVVAAFSRQAENFRAQMELGRHVDDESVVPAIARLQQVLGDTQFDPTTQALATVK